MLFPVVVAVPTNKIVQDRLYVRVLPDMYNVPVIGRLYLDVLNPEKEFGASYKGSVLKAKVIGPGRRTDQTQIRLYIPVSVTELEEYGVVFSNFEAVRNRASEPEVPWESQNDEERELLDILQDADMFLRGISAPATLQISSRLFKTVSGETEQESVSFRGKLTSVLKHYSSVITDCYLENNLTEDEFSRRLNSISRALTIAGEGKYDPDEELEEIVSGLMRHIRKHV